MTDEDKITCNGLGVVPSVRVRPTPKGWREGPLPSYDRCPGCAACPPTAEQLIEARVRAEADSLREQLAVVTVERDDAIAKAEHNFAAYRRVRAELAEEIARKIEAEVEDIIGDGHVDGLRAGARIARLAAGSSPDTTPEPKRRYPRTSELTDQERYEIEEASAATWADPADREGS